MEARDERSIRPLPPEIPDDMPPGGPPKDRLRWVPIAAVGAVIVILGAAGGIMSRDDAADAGGVDPFAAPATTTTTVPSLSADAPDTTTTTTTTTLPPTLADILPDLATVSAASVSETGGSTLRWIPGVVDPTASATTGRPDTVAFNADGSQLAYIAYFLGWSGALHVGSTIDQPAQYVQVTSFAWHDTEPNAIAWVAADPSGESQLLQTGTVDAESSLLVIDEESVEVAAGTWISSWGGWGYLTSRVHPEWDYQTNAGYEMESPPDFGDVSQRDPSIELIAPLGITSLRATDGTVVASTPAIVRETSVSGTSLLFSTAEAYEFASAAESNKKLGFRGEFIPPHPGGLYLARRDLTPHPEQPELVAGLQYVLSPDGLRVAEIFSQDAAALTTQTVGARGTRVIGLERPLHLLGFTPDTAWVIGYDNGREQLVFVDWRSGARRYLAVPDGGWVAAVHVR